MKIHSFSFALVLTFLLFAVPATAQKAVRDVTGDLANQRNTLSFSAGYGYIASKIIGEGSGGLHHGVDVRAGWDYKIKGINCIGIMASFYTSSASYEDEKERFTFLYFGPQYVLRSQPGKRWRFAMAVGFGALVYHDKFSVGHKKGTDSSLGYGTNMDFTVEYCLSPSLSLTATIGDYYGAFKQVGLAYYHNSRNTDWSTMERFHVSLGLAYHFNTPPKKSPARRATGGSAHL